VQNSLRETGKGLITRMEFAASEYDEGLFDVREGHEFILVCVWVDDAKQGLELKAEHWQWQAKMAFTFHVIYLDR